MASGQADLLRQFHHLFESGCVGGLTDAELLGRFVSKRDEHAFEALVRRHGPMVLRICRGVLQDRHTAEDAFQATFLVLARKAGAIHVSETLSGWLHGVALRVAAKARSQNARRLRREDRAAFTDDWEPGVDPDRVHVEAMLHEEVHRLPESYRSPIILCYLQGMSYALAARQLGVSEGTLRGRLARARNRLRARLTRRGVAAPAGLPTLAAARLLSAAAETPSGLVESVVRAATYAIASEGAGAGTVSASVAGLTKGVLQSMFIAKLRMTATALVLAVAGLTSAATFLAEPEVKAADPGATPQAPLVGENEIRDEGDVPLAAPRISPPEIPSTAPEVEGEAPESRSSNRASNGDEPAEPILNFEAIPKPWETVVRIKVHRNQVNDSVGFGSGTIIRSTPEESLILACAHILKLDGDQAGLPHPYPHRVTVDLFDGVFHDRGKAQTRFLESWPAEVVDYDVEKDVGLLRIRPGRTLAASPIVPLGWDAQPGMNLMTVGCSSGADATAWSTQVVKPGVQLFNNSSYEGIECTFAPMQGRSGGGLFTTEGRLAGVCNYSEPKGNHGFYATPKTIHHFLACNGLAAVDSGNKPGGWVVERKSTQEAANEPNFDLMIRAAEQQLRNGDSQGVRATTDRLADQLRLQRKNLQSKLQRLDELSGRNDKLRRAADGNEPPDLARGQSWSRSPRAWTSTPSKDDVDSSSSDQERRLRKVEQILDRLLQERFGDG